jgi:hypothetical protein
VYSRWFLVRRAEVWSVDGMLVSPAVDVAGVCDACERGDIEVTPALLRLMGSDGRTPLVGEVQFFFVRKL